MSSAVRRKIRADREANNWAVVRRSTLYWTADTAVGQHLRWLIGALDGLIPLTSERRSAILMAGYYRTTAGDGYGDDIHALIEAIDDKKYADPKPSYPHA